MSDKTCGITDVIATLGYVLYTQSGNSLQVVAETTDFSKKKYLHFGVFFAHPPRAERTETERGPEAEAKDRECWWRSVSVSGIASERTMIGYHGTEEGVGRRLLPIKAAKEEKASRLQILGKNSFEKVTGNRTSRISLFSST